MPAHVRGVQLEPHWFGVPPPPQVSPFEQVPQLTVPLQPSVCEPQVALAAVQASVCVSGTQAGAPHSNGTPPPAQVSSPLHVPQSMKPPQPFGY
jgi:hypothetical protein